MSKHATTPGSILRSLAKEWKVASTTWTHDTGPTREPRWFEYWKLPYWLLAETYFVARCLSDRGPARFYGFPYIIPAIRENKPVYVLRHDQRGWFGWDKHELAVCETVEQAFDLAKHQRDNPVIRTERGSDGKLTMSIAYRLTMALTKVKEQAKDVIPEKKKRKTSYSL